MARRAVVRWAGNRGMQDNAAGARPGRHVDALDVLLVGADVADVREGEGYDLSRIGWIGQDLLIAGHRGVEADFTDRMAGRAEPETLQHGSVGQQEERRGLGFRPSPGRIRLRLGHALLVAYYVCEGKGRSARPLRICP